MEPIMGLIGGLVLGAAIGFFIVRTMLAKGNQGKIEEMNRKADLMLQEARLTAKRTQDEARLKAGKIVGKAESKNENIKQKKIQEAKDKFNSLKSNFEIEKAQHLVNMKDLEVEAKALKSEIQDQEEALTEKQEEFDLRRQEVENKEAEIKTVRENLDKQMKIVAKKKEQLDAANEERIKALENISKLTEGEAKEQLLEAVKAKAETDAMSLVKDTITRAKADANKEAKKIVIQTIQRMCAEYTIENTVSVFNLESDDLKGQIIGREGRNIRALEAATGAEIVVDDTPEAIVISSFDPIRREVCRLSLKRLVADGRIHPARIEEIVEKTKKQLTEQIIEIGERTVIDLDIHGLQPYLVKMVGRMRFRSSYGQNLLKHSIETANLCAMMAAELGLSPKQVKMAKRAGLLHDIGKVAEEESELSHAILGMKISEKHGEHAVVCNAVGAHHDEVEMNNIISPLVQACDAISGARPGARREILESYLKRISELEDLAMAHDGVQKAFAMQAGNNGLGLMLLGLTGDQILEPVIYNELKEKALKAVRGTVQADILKEDQAQNTCIFSTEFSLKLMGDMQQYFIDNQIRNFYSVSISGYHIAEAGANPITQLALTLSNGFTFIEYYLARGMNIDEFAPNLSFFFSNGVDPEYAVIGRVARRIWAKAMKHKYAANERSQKLKYHIQTSGRSLHAQEIDFNDIRTTLQALYAIYDNCNSLHTNAYDEAITTPTEESVRRAVAIQMIINHELGLSKNENPLQGAFIIEELTDLVEFAVLAEFDKITERGGVLGAMETMYQRSKIQEESMHYEMLKHSGEYPIIGVNTFLSSKGSPTIIPKEVIRATTEEKETQIANLKMLHKSNPSVVKKAIKELQDAAIANENVFEQLIECVKYCSLGQVTNALFAVGGQYRRSM